MSNVIQAAVIPSLTLKVEDAEYVAEFPLSAVIELEKAIGRELKTLQQWLALKAEDIPTVLKAGLLKHHPEVTAEQIASICNRLNPEALDEVHYSLCKLAFPRAMEALDKVLAERMERTAPKNGGSADAR
jgi:hypothetical protein